MTAAFTVRVKDETASKLDQLAEKLDRSRSYMAAEAIEAFVEQQEWQLAEIEAGLAEADGVSLPVMQMWRKSPGSTSGLLVNHEWEAHSLDASSVAAA